MRYDINIALVVSVDTFDEEEARDLAERIAATVEGQADWAAGVQLAGPATFAMVEEVTPVDD